MTMFLPSVFFPVNDVVDGLRLLSSACSSRKVCTDKQPCKPNAADDQLTAVSAVESVLDEALDMFDSTKTRVCSSCRYARAKSEFSNRQWSKEKRECILCIELKPVVQALAANMCTYCNKKQHALTREHIKPKSLGGTFRPRICCKQCNIKRGNSLDFPPYTRLIRDCPAVYARAYGGAPTFNNKMLTPLQQRAINAVLDNANSTAAVQLCIMHFPLQQKQ